MKRNQPKTARARTQPASTAQPVAATFLDHVRELQVRLFFVAAAFLLSSAVAYTFIGQLVNLIVAPLGKSIQLVYLSPGGAFNFLIQACLYVGALGALPIIVYQVYRFVMPAVATVSLRRAPLFTVASCILAAGGVVFAYVVALPAALYFLTNFNLYHINPMLTIDAYFSFVMTYLVAGAALFQLPLLMLLINSVHPLTPSGLMRAQPKIILGSFIVAAIISPTPDALNQTLLASPIVVMYQAGIVILWAINRKARRRTVSTREVIKHQAPAIGGIPAQARARAVQAPKLVSAAARQTPSSVRLEANVAPGAQRREHRRSLDGMRIGSRGRPRRAVVAPQRSAMYQAPHPTPRRAVRSLDGYVFHPIGGQQ